MQCISCCLCQVFRNEDKSGWVDFWTFANKILPCLNTPETTIITDWEKGSIKAIAEVLPLAVNFFCSFHQKKNIETFVKGGKGKYSCHWFYQQLLNCSLQETLTKLHYDHSAHINDKALQYINLVPDHQSFWLQGVQWGIIFAYISNCTNRLWNL